MALKTFIEAIREGLREEMTRDDDRVLFCEHEMM
jgi:pyruvate/2-oxoglutarate/acetoin dehydrogenase E1 component